MFCSSTSSLRLCVNFQGSCDLIDRQKYLHPGKQPFELQKLSDTQSVCRYAAVCRFYDSISATAEEVAEPNHSNDVERSIEARGVLDQVASFSFIISLTAFDRILTCTKQLSDQLQSSTLDLSLASELVLATQSLLTEHCSDSYWKTIYDYAMDIVKVHNITVTVYLPAGRLGRKIKHPDRFDAV